MCECSMLHICIYRFCNNFAVFQIRICNLLFTCYLRESETLHALIFYIKMITSTSSFIWLETNNNVVYGLSYGFSNRSVFFQVHCPGPSLVSNLWILQSFINFWILRNFLEHPFHRTPPDDRFELTYSSVLDDTIHEFW